MAWVAITGAVASTVAVLWFVLVTRRDVHMDELGAVSRQWLADHSK
jgi:hypothetical protein